MAVNEVIDELGDDKPKVWRSGANSAAVTGDRIDNGITWLSLDNEISQISCSSASSSTTSFLSSSVSRFYQRLLLGTCPLLLGEADRILWSCVPLARNSSGTRSRCFLLEQPPNTLQGRDEQLLHSASWKKSIEGTVFMLS